MLSWIRRPVRTAWAIAPKSSSTRTSDAASRATSVPRFAHRDPDVGGLERGRVVDAVAGHADDLAAGAQGADDAQLVGGHGPGDDVGRGQAVGEGVVVQGLELGAGDDVVGRDPGAAGDRARGVGVVAGDHDDPDAGALAQRDRLGGVVAQRIGEPDQPDHLEREVVGVGRRLAARRRGRGRRRGPAGRLRHRLGPAQPRPGVVVAEVAEVDDRLGRALGRDHRARAVAVGLPDVGDREQAGPQRVLADRLPARVQVLGAAEGALGELGEREVHRVGAFGRAGEEAELDQRVDLLGQLGGRRRSTSRSASAVTRRRMRHPVLGERAGLVGAEHGDRAQGLDRGRAPGQHAVAGDAPGAEREEDGEDDRQLLGQERHRQGDARTGSRAASRPRSARGSRPARPTAPGRAMARRVTRRATSRSSGVLVVSISPSAAPIWPSSEAGPVATISASGVAGRRPGSRRRGRRGAAVAAGRPERRGLGRQVGRGLLDDRHRLAGEERLVDRGRRAGAHQGVGGDAVALGDQDDVAGHQQAGVEAGPGAVAADHGVRARQVAERVERALGPALLDDGDADDERRRSRRGSRPRAGRRRVR